MACTPDDIACAVRELTHAVANQQPTEIDVWTLMVAVVGVLGSFGVGLAAWTKRPAVKIADRLDASKRPVSRPPATTR